MAKKFGKMFSKDVMAYGAGAGVGVVVPSVLKYYVEPTYGAYVPGIDQTLGVWGKWGTFIPIVTGAIALVVPAFAKRLKAKGVKPFLTMYGITSLLSGVMSGAFDSMVPIPDARARAYGRAPVALRPMARAAPVRMARAGGGLTPTGISGNVIYA